MHVDTQTVMSDSNGMAGAMGESHIRTRLAIVLDCTDAQYTANCRLMDQLLWQFSFEAVHSSCYESMAFNDWWDYVFLVIIVSGIFHHPSRKRV